MKITQIQNCLNWARKNILILGFGREGRDTLVFLRRVFPDAKFGAADKNKNLKPARGSKNIEWYLGENYLGALKQYDIIIKAPGIPPKVIGPFLNRRQKITSQTEIFFDVFNELNTGSPGKIIGVTGTKGKSTTASLIYRVLKEAGLPVHLVGNIGKPVLSSLLRAKQGDLFVYELSSHQLHGLKKSPHIAVFLNLYPEHLDYYRSFHEYAHAKANICRWQTESDYVVFNSKDRLVKDFAQKSKAKKIAIEGRYYNLDREAARAVGKLMNIQPKIVEQTIRNFSPLPHRLEFAGKVRGVTFYNDSLSTIPQSTIAAIDFLGKNVKTLIAGGFDRGVDFKELAEYILRSGIKTLILFPPSGIRLAGDLKKQKNNLVKNPRTFPNVFFAKNMKEAVDTAFKYTPKNKICLLSPASASFGLFRDYNERGNAFKKYIGAIE